MQPQARDYRKIQAWERAHQMALQVYRATSAFPRDELFGLTSQIRRAAVSVPSNIAEGCGRGTEGELARFLQIAQGSGCELNYQLLLAHDLSYLDHDLYTALDAESREIGRMMYAYAERLRADR